MSTAGIDVNNNKQRDADGENKRDSIEDEILTPKLRNTSFFRTKVFTSENFEITNNGNSSSDRHLETQGGVDSDNVVKSIVQAAEQKIWELIDQPSKCIRDEYDHFDFRHLINEDLSSLTPMTLEEFPCLLVNSKESMLQCVKEIEVR